MLHVTNAESKALLTLFKDVNTNYNANSIAKKIGITRAGALKILKQFKEKGLVKGKKFGRASFYKLKLEDQYVRKVIETLLMAEAREKAGRWLFEFRTIFPHIKIAIIFGSAIRNYEKADDIDIVLVFDEQNLKNVNEFIASKNKILPKKIHPIIQTSADIKKNLNASNEVLLNAVRLGYVLYGYNELIGVIGDVARF